MSTHVRVTVADRRGGGAHAAAASGAISLGLLIRAGAGARAMTSAR
ncbi:hypothetical protein [Streptosporangium sp. NPDC000396]